MNIEIIPFSEEIENFIDCPKPSKFSIPEWYKKSEPFSLKNAEFSDDGKIKNLKLKQCMPFLDAITSGYIQKTWTDIYVKNENNVLTVRTASGPTILMERNGNPSIGISKEEYYPVEFIWQVPYAFKMPKGYSLLFTHPLNRLDLPFTTLSGIMDSDDFYHVPNGSYPFYIKNTFEGIIPSGTPMYQIIPIKRESWFSKQIKFNKKKINKRNFLFSSTFINQYKNHFWKKKEYY